MSDVRLRTRSGIGFGGRDGADGWDRWLGAYRPATQAAYRRDIEDWTAFCRLQSVNPLEATRGDTTAWIQQMTDAGMRPATRARKVAALASLYAWARDEGLTSSDPIPRRRPRVPEDDRQIHGLSAMEARRLLDASQQWGPREHAFVALLLTTGLRVSEALEADVTDIHEVRGHHALTVLGKGGRPRTVAIPPTAWNALASYVETWEAGPLFVTRSGSRWDRVAAGRTLTRLGNKVGLANVHPHLLRHTAASLALDAGAPLDRVQSLLGHADPRTTMRYAAARDRLDTSAAYDVARLLGDHAESVLTRRGDG
jgi:site-specific recombinase XerD